MDAPSLVIGSIAPTANKYSARQSTIPPPRRSQIAKVSIEEERTSSDESAIFSIYSMYGDEGGSWSLPTSVDHNSSKLRRSFLHSSQHTIEDSAYYDSTYEPHLQAPQMDYKRSSSSGETRHTARTIPSVHSPSPGPSRHSATPSVHSTRMLPPTPPRTPSISSTPPPSNLPPPRISTLNISAAPSPLVSPLSLVPSSVAPYEGEDPDAFHVRRTYAELERMGVKGDGYIEGVERTRAKIGANRSSELRAMEALGDGTEKKRDLTPREYELLSNLDRYGFFTTSSHDRLMGLASLPFTKPLSRTPSVITTAEASVTPLKTQPSPPNSHKEINRALKWGRMMEAQARDPGGNVAAWGIKAAKEAKFRERVYKGIPDCWRSAAWELMMNRMTKSSKRELDILAEDYQQALDKPSTYDVQIDLDVPRTISGHVLFRTRYGQGQRSLFHVLHSFSLQCPECGYCQGMGPIAATLLSYFDPPRVYGSLVRLHDNYSMHAIFRPGFPGLLEAIYVQEQITKLMMPAVYEAFKQHTISTTSYATKWYITLFANSVPFHTQLRLWDVFFLEGADLFVIMAVAIVWCYKDQITSAGANFETILSLLSAFFVPDDDNTLLGWIDKVLADPKIRANMQSLRDEWKGLVASKQEGDALL